MSDSRWPEVEGERLIRSMETPTFRRQYQGEFPVTKIRCEMKSKFDRCPNEARFLIKAGEAVSNAHVCDQCIVPWMMSIRPGVTILIVRL